ncbi:LOW QUALITY PROTEIN: microtubule-associated protein 10 [Gymnogyps californianus]|uniref:LOW QUALITY PROTEIN: microtubule-associated protein 10 n=1 Tax=Gymnogyps californianus TaxID=33616 RepID=UPI0021C738EE|nr:LOW QUALITY PROTEIN: microtubule-associated protein 10 [Gymnogyps californianus]
MQLQVPRSSPSRHLQTSPKPEVQHETLRSSTEAAGPYNGTAYGEHVDIVKVNDITTESTFTGKRIIIIARVNNTNNIVQIGLRCALAALSSSSYFHNGSLQRMMGRILSQGPLLPTRDSAQVPALPAGMLRVDQTTTPPSPRRGRRSSRERAGGLTSRSSRTHTSRETGARRAMAAAAAAAGGAEGLFALELLVEAVRVAAPGPALRPAVALRLLDFPTLLLRPAAAAPPLRPGRAFPFGRGKRCLFRWRRGSLCAALRGRPLRALLLALPAGLAPGPPRLLGSCGVSLAPAAAELLQRPGAPASCGRRGRFPLRDAAGRPVGELVLGYRLTSLEAGEEPPLPSPASPRAATPPAASPEPEEEVEELEGNTFCPPVLYYSREPAEPHLPPAAAAIEQWEHVEASRPQEKDKGQSPPRPSAGPSLLHPASLRQLHNTLGQLPLLSALLAELSVLTHSATPAAVHPHLAWLYQALGSGGMASQPLSPSCSSALKPAEAPVGPGGSSGAASPRFKQGRQEATSPGSSRAGRGPKKAVPQGETGSERNRKTKENRPPRKKLLYGLTNTLRLRLQQTNPDKLIIHERREQYRKKQMEVLKERSPLCKRKLLRNASEQHVVSYRHCSKGDSSKQNNEFDKTIEASLPNSALSDYVSVTGDLSPDLQKQAIASLLKNDEIATKERPCKVSTAPLVEETALKSAHKEKCAKAQLPAAFPSHANAKGSNDETIHLIHRKTTERDDASVVSDHKPSPSRSIENNSEFIYSDDFVASPENTVYSEDFTSAECTGRDSEALDSSPEPLWLESPKRGWSDTEPESSRSRISKTSQRAESTLDLPPVPSASSPVQSLKRNGDLKTSKRTSGESVDSLNLARMEALLLGEEQEAQHISKEENRGDQHIKQVSTLRSKQVSSDTDPNIGKGQTSGGKSQSVTQVNSYLPSNMSDLELSVLENSMSDKEEDFLGKLRVPNQYKDISELVINKLPGYTM